MECEIEKHNPTMADEQQDREPERTKRAQDLDDDDVEAILSRSRNRPILNLYEAPEFVKRLNSFEEVKVGDTVVFSCQWRALPKPAIKWYKDDEEITESERYKHDLEEDSGLQSLIIEDCRKADEGAYKCKAENQEGVASTTGYLSVTGTDPGEAAPPPHSLSEHCISVPPPRGLRTIVEQKSLEEREEEEYSQLPPSPIQDFIDNAVAARRGHTWPYAQLGYTPDDFTQQLVNDEYSDSSDTSVESQEYDHVSFEVRPRDDDDDDEYDDDEEDDRQVLLDHDNLCLIQQQEDSDDFSPPVMYNQQHTAPFSYSESETSSSDVSTPEIHIETVKNRRKRLKRLPLQRTTAIETEENDINKALNNTSKIEKDDKNKAEKKMANGSSFSNKTEKRVFGGMKDFTVAKVSKVALASFNPDNVRAPVVEDITDTSVVRKVFSAPSLTVSSSRGRSLTEEPHTVLEVLGVDIVDVMEHVLDSPVLYYVLLTSCCAFLGAATEMPVPFFVLAVAILALISFRFLHHPTTHKF